MTAVRWDWLQVCNLEGGKIFLAFCFASRVCGGVRCAEDGFGFGAAWCFEMRVREMWPGDGGLVALAWLGGMVDGGGSVVR
jgi:hypothetical protein